MNVSLLSEFTTPEVNIQYLESVQTNSFAQKKLKKINLQYDATTALLDLKHLKIFKTDAEPEPEPEPEPESEPEPEAGECSI
jgi:hypothetical protein